jgi:peptidoglycan hydrolase CwlO-like protein
MGFFGKKNKVVDWSEGYKISSVRKPIKTSSSTEGSSNLGFLGDMAASSEDSSSDVSWDNDSQATVGEYQEKKQKVAKRLLDMTDKIEDLSNQVYHLKQRIELLEKKMKVSYG